MRQKFSEEINELIEDTKQEFNKLKQKKDKRLIFFIPLLIPLFFPEVLIFGIICLTIYFIYNPRYKK